MVTILDNKIYIRLYIEEAQWLIENTNREIWIVHANNKNKNKEKVTKENYIDIINQMDLDWKNNEMTGSLFLVDDIGDLTVSHSSNSRGETYVNYTSTHLKNKHYTIERWFDKH